jgi:hypothetical protein
MSAALKRPKRRAAASSLEIAAVRPAVEERRVGVVSVDARETDEVHGVPAESEPVAPMDEQVPIDPPGKSGWE